VKSQFFVVRDNRSIKELPDFLKTVRYNTFLFGEGIRDINRNRLIPLLWDQEPDKDMGKKEKVGMICIVKKSLYGRVKKAVGKNCEVIDLV